ncbi:MAG TPA: efflux RND transporter periplasmic adaptor subunit [Gemmataceae bacterium]|nr:efflux RND transporter periplasmic adaptor subunit [Gemmataceae bacterium]
MSYLSSYLTGAALFLGCCLGLAGCARTPSGTTATAPTPVTVSYPLERRVTEYLDFTGTTAAVDSVEVRAHVWGYLDQVNFKEGALVKKGDVLFEIDRRTYRAALDQAKADLESKKAAAVRAEAVYRRTASLVATQAAATEDADKDRGDWLVCKANVGLAAANVRTAELNLGFTRVTAPIGGRVGRIIVTVGNLVQSGDQSGGTVLTTIVSENPIYANFDVNERTVQHVRQLIREGKAKSARDTEVPVVLGLASEQDFPHRGVINFVDNQVNPKTGTLRVRGVFPNKGEVLSPGFFVRVRVRVGEAHKALLVTDRAIDSDQGQKIVYVVNEKNEVLSHPIRVGAAEEGGLRVITDGVKRGERVIVNGLQRVRPGVTVEPKLVDMPVRPAARSPGEVATPKAVGQDSNPDSRRSSRDQNPDPRRDAKHKAP